MTHVRATAFAILFCGLLATPAFADITAFIGANTTPSNRQVRGLAVGIGLLVVGFEFELANTTDDPTTSRAVADDGLGQHPVADADGHLRLSAVFHDRRRVVSRDARHARGHELRASTPAAA